VAKWIRFPEPRIHTERYHFVFAEDIETGRIVTACGLSLAYVQVEDSKRTPARRCNCCQRRLERTRYLLPTEDQVRRLMEPVGSMRTLFTRRASVLAPSAELKPAIRSSAILHSRTGEPVTPCSAQSALHTSPRTQTTAQGHAGSATAMKDPQTPQEWQEAVDSAAAWRAIADCMIYGFLKGPQIDFDRCTEILDRGEKLGVRPSGPVVDLAVQMVRAHNYSMAKRKKKARKR
jgi:hypothetical protein